MVLQIYLTYFNSSMYRLNNLKMYNFLTYLNYILFSFIFFIIQLIRENHFS